MPGDDEEELSASITPDTAGSEKRTAAEQKTWEQGLQRNLAKQRKEAEDVYSRIQSTLQPGVIDFKYIDKPDALRRDLMTKYHVSTNHGKIKIGHSDDPSIRKTAISLGVAELMATTAVPIIKAGGGTLEEKIDLLKALAAVDFSVEPSRLQPIVAEIRKHAATLSHEEALDLESLCTLSELNATLHAEQQKLPAPLDRQERRKALEAAIQKKPESEALSRLLEECDQGFVSPDKPASEAVRPPLMRRGSFPGDIEQTRRASEASAPPVVTTKEKEKDAELGDDHIASPFG